MVRLLLAVLGALLVLTSGASVVATVVVPRAFGGRSTGVADCWSPACSSRWSG
jgi:hypothetical protein